MITPWGNSDSEKHYERGLTWVGTPSHSGFLVGKAYARKHRTPAAQAVGEPFGQYLAFEEDCKAAVILFELPATRVGFSSVSDAELIHSLSVWESGYLAARAIAPTAEPVNFGGGGGM
jgi:hypothetical protein